MSTTVDIDRAFAEELTALETFFDRRAGEHEHFLLGRQDPDVRRILEAVAFFSARTRLLAVENLRRLVNRVVRGQLDYLLTPVPTAGLLEIQAGDLPAPVLLPRATEVRLTTADRTVGIFTTTRPLALLPVVLARAGVMPVADEDTLVLDLTAGVSVRGSLPPVSFYVDHRGNYRDSLRLFGEIRAAVVGARVSFDDEGPEQAAHAEVAFGAPDPARGGRYNDGVHPVERIRSFFHAPSQELFFHVTLPARPRPWSKARIYLDLSGDLPAELFRTSAATFPLHVVPIANVRRGDSEIISCDGTKDAYAIRDARTPLAGAGREAESRLAAVVGVYQIGDTGRAPIPTGLVATSGPVYDLRRGGAPSPDAPVQEIALRIPGAFAKPVKVVVDARWYQPSFDVHAAGRLQTALQTRRIEGARMSVRGDLTLHRDSDLWDDALAVLDVLALKTKPLLSRDELCTLLRYAGADKQTAYRRLPDLVKDVRVSIAPENGARGTIRYVYELVWQKDDPDFAGLRQDGLVRCFEDQVAAFLDAWLADDVDLVRLDAVSTPALLAPWPMPARLAS